VERMRSAGPSSFPAAGAPPGCPFLSPIQLFFFLVFFSWQREERCPGAAAEERTPVPVLHEG